MSVAVADPSGRPVAAIESLVLRPANPEQFGKSHSVQDSLFRLEWSPLPVTARSRSAGTPLCAGWFRPAPAAFRVGNRVVPRARRRRHREWGPRSRLRFVRALIWVSEWRKPSIRPRTRYWPSSRSGSLTSGSSPRNWCSDQGGRRRTEPGKDVPDLAGAAVWRAGPQRTGGTPAPDHPGRLGRWRDPLATPCGPAVASGEPQLAFP